MPETARIFYLPFYTLSCKLLRKSMGKGKISENMISRLWQCLWGKELVTDTNETVQIIYPGRPSTDSGPDFHDAVVAINGQVIKGDIEVHTNSRGWFNHRHHEDPNYSQTILHLVWQHNPQFPAFLKAGKQIPVVSLSPFSSYQTSLRQPCLPCSQISHRLSQEGLLRLLRVAGEERFKTKVNRFSISLTDQDAGQVLWRGIMRALGYTKNVRPFEELSQRLPLNFLENLETNKSLAMKQAWLLGTAGLLPSQRLNRRILFPREPEAIKLERLWHTTGFRETIKEEDWHFVGVRPTNFPSRRLVALSYLLNRYWKSGLLRGILKLLRQTPVESGYTKLEDSLIVLGRGYWAYHFDFNLATRVSSALLGRGKAAEIIINIILPFATAWANIAGEPKLKKTASELFCYYPKLTDNEITRHMRQQIQLSNGANISLIHQQGLLHIFTTYCRDGNCSICPVVS